MSMYTALGFLAGAAIAIVAALIIRAKYPKGEYDERQELLRGRAYRHAFLTVLILAAIHAMFVSLTERPIMEDGVSAMLLVLVGVAVFAIDCILHDAFFTVKTQPVPYLCLCALCVLANAVGGITNLLEGECFRDGLLTTSCFSLAVGVVFLAVFVTIILKVYVLREAEDE